MQFSWQRFRLLTGCVLLLLLVSRCSRNEIGFGTISDDNYTELLQIDTVGISLSTVFRDSFETGNVTSFLLGRYRDPGLGTITGGIFTQITVPSQLPEIPASAVFDSLVLMIKGNQYYYGDTSRPISFLVYELANNITTGYNSNLYNTSSVAVKQPALGQRQFHLRPLRNDSLTVRLSDALGMEWMSMIRAEAVEIKEENRFINYFKGISVAVQPTDTGAVVGISGNAGDIVIRLFYHTVFPYKESRHVDFTNLQNELQFNQLLHDRTGTGLISSRIERIEIPSTATFNRALTQPGMNIWMKASFPGLRSLLIERENIRLLKAELIVYPARLSYNDGSFRLPNRVYLKTTNSTNLDGNEVLDSSGSSVLYADPQLDQIYGVNTHYRFNITNYISAWLNTPGSEQYGFFFHHENSTANLTRLVVDDRFSGNKPPELRLQVLAIKTE